MAKKLKNVVIIGGGVGSSIFTKAVKDFPINLTTIVSSFDDGGSTGVIRRDYGGIAVGDLRQCILANLELSDEVLSALNFRFGKGHLFGVSSTNMLLRAFLATHDSERIGVHRLHKLLGLRHQAMPVSYDYAKLEAELSNGKKLKDQAQVAAYVGKGRARIKKLILHPRAGLNPDARRALLNADYIIFAPGHFFTSILPHLYVQGFVEAWKRSKAKKIWFVNLLTWQGQDDDYTVCDHLRWYQEKIGKKPFDIAVVNRKIPQSIMKNIHDRFAPLHLTEKDKKCLAELGIELALADLVSPVLVKQNPNDPVPRAPLRHNSGKINKFFKQKFNF